MVEMTIGVTAGSVLARETMPACGIAAGTPVLTLKGAMPVEQIAPGDRVITRNGARPVTSVEIAIVPAARVMRISEGVLGRDRPEADTFVTPGQQILIRDWRAKALAGLDQALMTADRLADGDYIRTETVAEARIVTLRFAEPQVIYAAGLELVCDAAE